MAIQILREVEMAEKLYMFCKNMEIVDDRGCGGTMTGPWGDKGPSCSKGHFNHYQTSMIDDMDDFRKLILQAETCLDYEQA